MHIHGHIAPFQANLAINILNDGVPAVGSVKPNFPRVRDIGPPRPNGLAERIGHMGLGK